MNLIIPIIVAGVSLLLNIVGLAIPYWLYYSIDQGEMGKSTINIGLWQACGRGGGRSACVNTISDIGVDSSLDATKAMELLGMLLLIGAIVCAVLKLLAMKEQGLLPKVAGACAVAAGVLMIIGCIIFAAKFKKDHFDNYDLHAGFALCIVAAVGSIVACILFFMSKDD